MFELPNETKIAICNLMDALQIHSVECRDCAVYIKSGDGDLCAKGKQTITEHLAYANTKPDLREPKLAIFNG